MDEPSAQPSPEAAEERPEPAAAESATPVLVPNPRALIFDLDGTLVDTVQLRIQAWLRTFEEVGIPAERSHVAGLIGADGKRLAMEVAAVADRRLSDERAEAIDRRAGEIFGELNSHPRPQPGVPELLSALDEVGVPWSIATSSRRDQVRPSVAALGLRSEPHITDGSHVAQAKPAPDLLLLAAEQLELAPRACWYIGDSTWDMRAARAASMTGVGIASGAVDTAQLQAAGARLAFADIGLLQAELVMRGILPAPNEERAAS